MRPFKHIEFQHACDSVKSSDDRKHDVSNETSVC